ncbi:hypothetical protein EV122DRAFT_185738, partial [Schizophyllum commune]
LSALLHETTHANARNIPLSTTDTTAARTFSRPFTDDEIDGDKRWLRLHAGRVASGIDRVTYQGVLSIPNDALASLLNTCIANMKPAASPDSYRLIGLESCLLKVLMLLIDRRFREWVEAEKIIPQSQN